jgi:hypothetical protein
MNLLQYSTCMLFSYHENERMTSKLIYGQKAESPSWTNVITRRPMGTVFYNSKYKYIRGQTPSPQRRRLCGNPQFFISYKGLTMFTPLRRTLPNKIATVQK